MGFKLPYDGWLQAGSGRSGMPGCLPRTALPTEAARAVLDAAIATGRKRLWATVGAWNTPSFRVLEKLGFERDHVSVEDVGEVVWLTRSLP